MASILDEHYPGCEREELSDGNINSVFRLVGKGMIVKVALPWLRIDKQWPVPLQRLHYEHLFYEACSRAAATGVAFTPTPVLFNSCSGQHSVLAVTDLHPCTVLRHTGSQAAPQDLGVRLAAILSLLRCCDTEGFNENPMIQLTVNVVFTWPWTSHPSNSGASRFPRHSLDIAAFVGDCVISHRVSELLVVFLNTRETLCHGDLHTGSVMVSDDSVYLIDAEFSFIGPMTWDAANILAHLIIRYICAKDQATLRWIRQLVVNTRELNVRQLFGFAGVEIGRRLAGTVGVEEFNDAKDAAISKLLMVARNLLLWDEFDSVQLFPMLIGDFRLRCVVLGSSFSTDPPVGSLAELDVETPFGMYRLFTTENPLLFLCFRHGLPHCRLPHQINYRAMAWAIRSVGACNVLVTSSVGLLAGDLPPFVLLDIKDILMINNCLPDGSPCTMWNEKGSAGAHLVIQGSGLFSEQLRSLIKGSALPVHPREVLFGYVSGPRTKTPSESLMWSRLGADVNSMTLAPESVLLCELGLNVAALGVGHVKRGDPEFRGEAIGDSLKTASLPISQALHIFAELDLDLGRIQQQHNLYWFK